MIAGRVRGLASPNALMRRVFFVIALLCLLAPAGALASVKGGKRVVEDCREDGELKGHYSQSDYEYALAHLPSDLNAYTNCEEVIRAARRADAGGGTHSGGAGGGGGGGGGSTVPPVGSAPAPPPAAPTSAEKQTIRQAGKSPGPVGVGGGPPITPGGPGITTTSFTRAIPGPMVLVIALLLVGALAAAGPAIRSRVLARRTG